MPQAIKRKGDPVKRDPKITDLKEVDNTIESLSQAFVQLETREKLRLLANIGVGDKYLTCQYCGRPLLDSSFHQSSELNNKTKKARICINCVEKVVRPVVNGKQMPATKESIIEGLKLLNKPYADLLYDASVKEAAVRSINEREILDAWSMYIKNISMPQYRTLTYFNSDNYNNGATSMLGMEDDPSPKDHAIIEDFESNRDYIIKILGWDPFKKEQVADQPAMYAQMVGYLDSGNDENRDMMRISSVIEIIKGFNHRSKINDQLTSMYRDPSSLRQNAGTIKSLEDTKKKIGDDITNLAKESKISVASNKTVKKDASTWTGKVKLLKEKKLRSAEENEFDHKTCIGMKQVAEYSAEGLLKRVALDESASAEIIATQRRLVGKFKSAAEDAVEKARLLLRENADLKKRLIYLGDNITENLEPIPYDFNIEDEGSFNDIIDELLGYNAQDIAPENDSEYEIGEDLALEPIDGDGDG